MTGSVEANPLADRPPPPGAVVLTAKVLACRDNRNEPTPYTAFACELKSLMRSRAVGLARSGLLPGECVSVLPSPRVLQAVENKKSGFQSC